MDRQRDVHLRLSAEPIRNAVPTLLLCAAGGIGLWAGLINRFLF